MSPTRKQVDELRMLQEAINSISPAILAEAIPTILEDDDRIPDETLNVIANRIGRIPHKRAWAGRNG